MSISLSVCLQALLQSSAASATALRRSGIESVLEEALSSVKTRAAELAHEQSDGSSSQQVHPLARYVMFDARIATCN